MDFNTITNICFKEIININNLYMLSPETYIIIDKLNLYYLLFNNRQIVIDSDIPNIITVGELRDELDDVHKLNDILAFLDYSPFYICDFIDNITIEEICKYAYVDVLNWLENNKYDIKFKSIESIEDTINNAFINKYIGILDWFIDHPQYEFRYKIDAVYNSCYNLEILNWIILHPNHIDLKQIINMAIIRTHTNVLDFFAKCVEDMDSKIEFQYDENILMKISKSNILIILQWFANHPHIEFKYKSLLLNAQKNNYIDILNWFAKNNQYN